MTPRFTIPRAALGSAAVAVGLLFGAAPALGANTGPTCGGEPATIVGTTGNDEIRGTNGRDVIVGLGGDDTIRGLGGSDIICGGSGHDTLVGGRGHDDLYGGNGEDVLIGNRGDDDLHGGAKADELSGDEGKDRLYGDGGADVLLGKAGADKLWGDEGADVIAGHNGTDELRGGPGNDTLSGGDKVDQIWGGSGSDTCNLFEEAVDGCEGGNGYTGSTVLAGDLSVNQFNQVVNDEIFRLTNCARTNSSTWCETGDQTGWNVTAAERNGLSAYTRDTGLDETSEAWSDYLVNNRGFEHSPDSGTLYGENIFFSSGYSGNEYELTSAQALELADQMLLGWMNSAGHRAGILNSNFGTIGVGIDIDRYVNSSGLHEYYIIGTQQFYF